MQMTSSQKRALQWLTERGGTGVFDRNGVLLAAGETAGDGKGFMRSTWNALRDLGLLTIVGRRVTVCGEHRHAD